MINETKNLYNDYVGILTKYELANGKIRELKYEKMLVEKQLQTAEEQLQREEQKNSDLNAKLQEQEYEIQRLKALLNQDGTNSNIPTSQTPINKQKVIPNTREKTDKKRGGQEGHKKHKLEKLRKEEITEYVEHKMCECPNCKSKRIKENGKVIEKDVIDLTIIVNKIRHNFYEYECEECKRRFHESISVNIKEEAQYGPNLQALIINLGNQSNVTINKIQKLISGITEGEIEVSEGYIAKLQERAYKGLEKFDEELRKELIKEDIIHWDDTVIRINKQRGCYRFYGNEKIALYRSHLHKDKKGIDEDNILKLLPKETKVVHDHVKLNYNAEYQFTNVECNRHLMSDLQKIVDNLKHEWAKELKELLSETNKKRNELISREKDHFSAEEIKEFNREFERIMLKGIQENRTAEGKYYADKEDTLILRILDYKTNYTMWVYDFEVPFTNNLSERALRGAKSKMKSAGQFWNETTAKYYARIKTYIETCYRNGINVHEALLMLTIGKPYTVENVLSN